MRLRLIALCLFASALGFAQELQWLVQAGVDGMEICRDIAVDGEGTVYSIGKFDGVASFGSENLEAINLSDYGSAYIMRSDASGNTTLATIGGTGSSEAVNVAEKDGIIYITGTFNGTVDFDPDPNSIVERSTPDFYSLFILKLNSELEFESVWTFVQNSEDYIEADIAIDNDGNMYIGGVFSGTINLDKDANADAELVSIGSSDIFLTKYDPNGNLLWTQAMGSERNDALLELKFCKTTQSIVATGYFRERIGNNTNGDIIDLVSKGSWDIFIGKWSLDGNIIWVKQMGGPAWDTGYDLEVDTDGNIYSAGTFFERADFDPGSNEFILVSGDNDTTDFSVTSDGYLQKLDPDGNFVWAKSISAEQGVTIYDIELETSGEIFVNGVFHDQVRIDQTVLNNKENTFFKGFVAQYDKDANLQNTFTLGGCDVAIDQRIELDNNGSIIVAGNFQQKVAFSSTGNLYESRGFLDAFITKFSAVLTNIEMENNHKDWVYPNPVISNLNIVAFNKNDHFKIFDLTGREIWEGSQSIISVSEWTPGIYLLKNINRNINHFFIKQ